MNMLMLLLKAPSYSANLNKEKDASFISNNCNLSDQKSGLLQVQMGGKSTFLRQNARPT